MIKDYTPEEEVARINTDTEPKTVMVSPLSSPVSTAAMTVVVREVPSKRTVRE
jgi:hypothetical protein